MIRIIGRPEFYMPLTLDQVNVLTALAMHHYDPVCRSAIGPKGFLTAAAQHIRLSAEMEMDDDETSVALTYMQVDACIRMLEWTGALAIPEKLLADELLKTLVGARHTADEAAMKWKTSY